MRVSFYDYVGVIVLPVMMALGLTIITDDIFDNFKNKKNKNK